MCTNKKVNVITYFMLPLDNVRHSDSFTYSITVLRHCPPADLTPAAKSCISYQSRLKGLMERSSQSISKWLVNVIHESAGETAQ